MGDYLLRVEGVNMAASVYDTQDLGCVQGASLALLQAPSRVRAVLPPGAAEVYSGASQGLFHFAAADDRAAEAVAERARQSLAGGVFRHLAFVIDVVPDGADAERRALARNRVRQMRMPGVVLPDPAPAATTHCAIDRVRPGIVSDREGKLVSASVKDRRDYRRDRRRAFYKDEIGVDPALLPADDKHYSRSFEDVVAGATDAVPEALRHKMAVLYFDGNGFGAIRDRLGAAEFSRCLKDLRRGMMNAMIPAMGGLERAETILWGGDEMMWVVPAWRMVECLGVFFAATADWPHGMTHAGGVVACHYKTPIRLVDALVRDLAGRAKGGRDRTAVQIEILESLDIPEGYLTRQRQRLFGTATPDAAFTLGGDEWPAMVAAMRRARDRFPRSQLYALLHKARDLGALRDPAPGQVEALIAGLSKVLAAGEYGCSLADLAGDAPADGAFDGRLLRLARLATFWDYLEMPS